MVGGLMRETSGPTEVWNSYMYRTLPRRFQTLTLMGVIRPSMYRVPNKQHGNNQARA